jgi:hypothetical protein
MCMIYEDDRKGFGYSMGFTLKHGFTMSGGTQKPLEYELYCLKEQEDCSRA